MSAANILIIEDDADIREGVRILLEGEDYLPTVWYAADLSACVQYENGMFTLSGLHLDGIE